jgi:mucin-19
LAGSNSSDGSYIISGFVGSDGAFITQTTAAYNNANVASASSVTAAIGSSYTLKADTVLSNYALPTTASTAAGGGTITPAPLTMVAYDLVTFVNVPFDGNYLNQQYQVVGLLGADTKSNALSSATVTNSASLATPSAGGVPTVNALTPNATSSNYSLTFVKGSLLVVDDYQMVVNVGGNTAVYGVVTSTNSSYLGNA